MKNSFNFDIGEININKKNADELREGILSVARQNNIGENPIQYELLLKNIKAVMAELSNEIEFTFNGNTVDFYSDNQVIFTTRVLKSLFLEKLDAEIITIQTKNLDILSFYAFGRPRTKNIVSKIPDMDNNGGDEPGNIPVNIDLSKRKSLKYIIVSCFLFCVLVIIALTFLLIREHERNKRSEDEYQSVIEKLYNPIFFKYFDFSGKNYDTLLIPPKPIVFSVNFDDIESEFNNQNYFRAEKGKIEQIFDKEIFDIKPGIKYCKTIDRLAFGFGKTYCKNDCYSKYASYNKQNNLCILRITFIDSTFVSYISFNWIEEGYNWGSWGHVHINGEANYIGIDPYQSIGIFPNSNKIKDEERRVYKCKVERNVKSIDIAIWDITYESEIFISNLEIRGK